jgi:sugar lactone lactonase YvrE
VDAELVLDAHAETGEGPVWDAGSERLLWVDITRRRVHRFNPASGKDESFDVGQHVGAVAVRAAGGLVLALRGGFGLFDPDSGRVEPIADTEAGNPNNRMNDGKCDSAGRFWAGSMSYAEKGTEGSLYRLDPDRSVRRMLSGIGLSNGLGWSPDDTLMYYVDSLAARLDVFDFDRVRGEIANRRTVVEVPAAEGVPDGLTVDAEGYIWLALWGGGAVHRYRPDGTLDGEVRLPVRQVSCCTFGGPELADLYITSAARGLSAEQLEQQPGAGGVFHCRPGVHGLPSHAYAG